MIASQTHAGMPAQACLRCAIAAGSSFSCLVQDKTPIGFGVAIFCIAKASCRYAQLTSHHLLHCIICLDGGDIKYSKDEHSLAGVSCICMACFNNVRCYSDGAMQGAV